MVGREGLVASCAVAVALAVALLACGKQRSPTVATTPPQDDSHFFPPVVTIGGTIRGVMVPGDALQLSASYEPNGAPGQDRTAEATWESSAPSVLTVSPTGLAHALTIGVAVLTAKVAGTSGSVAITVASEREPLAGKIDGTVASDVIAFNQQAGGNLRPGLIMRWQVPVRVFVDPSIEGYKPCVTQAIEMWRAATGIPYTVTDVDGPPRLRILLVSAITAYSHVVATNPDNSTSVVDVVIGGGSAGPMVCASSRLAQFAHELGHALGIHGHFPDTNCFVAQHSTAYSTPGWHLCDREIRLLTELYKLPHGAHVEPDGTWVR